MKILNTYPDDLFTIAGPVARALGVERPGAVAVLVAPVIGSRAVRDLVDAPTAAPVVEGWRMAVVDGTAPVVASLLGEGSRAQLATVPSPGAYWAVLVPRGSIAIPFRLLLAGGKA